MQRLQGQTYASQREVVGRGGRTEKGAVQCRTYPFWPEHLISPLDWNAEALMKCEGMRTVPLRDSPEGDIKEKAIVQRMLGTELQRQWLEFHPSMLESLMEETDSSATGSYVSEFWEANYRQ